MRTTGPAQADGRRPRTLGIVLMVVGALVGVGGVVAAFAPLIGASTVRIEGPTAIPADAGAELALYRVDGGGREGSCAAEGPDGRTLPLQGVLGTETLTLGSTVYTVVGVLPVGTTGVQTVTCTGSGFAVGPRIGVFRVVGGVLLAGAVGVAAFVAGVVLVVWAARRDRPPGPPPGPWGPGPGTGPPQWAPGDQPGQPWPGHQPGQPWPGQQPGQSWPGQPWSGRQPPPAG